MPSGRWGQRQWWEAFSYVPGYNGPDDQTRRPCGCRIDPIVFGCPHDTPAGAA